MPTQFFCNSYFHLKARGANGLSVRLPTMKKIPMLSESKGREFFPLPSRAELMEPTAVSGLSVWSVSGVSLLDRPSRQKGKAEEQLFALCKDHFYQRLAT